MDSALRVVDRGAIFEAGRYAFSLHQWLTAPDFDEEGEVQNAEKHLAEFAVPGGTPLLAAARGMHAWLDAGGARASIRVALIRFWVRHRVVRTPVPLTGPAALRAETPFEVSAWLPAVLRALAEEAANGRQLLTDLERAWFEARAAIAGRRRDSHATAAVGLLAATPVLSATTLAKGLGLAIKTASRLLDGLVGAGVAIEVTHRSKRRLFGLKGMAPLGEAVSPTHRPEPGRGRGRPPLIVPVTQVPSAPLPPLTPVERRAFDYSDLAMAMAYTNQVICQTRRALDALRCASSVQDAGGGRDQAGGADAFSVPGIDWEA